MQRGKINFLIFLGVVLVISATGFASYNFYEDWAAGQAAQLALKKVKAELPDNDSGYTDSDTDEIETDGNNYIGILDIERFHLSLPIKATCSDSDLKTTPGKYYGSATAGDLVIAGHNYNSHFGYIGNLEIGDEVTFTDAGGRRFNYVVSMKEIIDGNDSERMLAGEWDMTLFTCTLEGSDRIAIRCKKISK